MNISASVELMFRLPAPCALRSIDTNVSQRLRAAIFAAACLIFTGLSYAQAPVILTQPVSQEASTGVTITLHVEAIGAEPLLYSWFKNGLLVRQSTQPSLVIEDISPALTGSYVARVSNSSGITNSQVARLAVNNPSVAIIPILLSGWNQDVILEDSQVPSATVDFDTHGAYWFEAGLGGHPDGLPSSTRFTSQLNTNVIFQLQPYNANNVLYLQGSIHSNTQGTLTLLTPAPYRSLAILASCGGESGYLGNLTLSFSDGTTATNLTYKAYDWSLGPTAGLAITGLGRFQAPQTPASYQNQGRGFGMYETDIDLMALGLERKFLTTLTFTKANDSLVTGIFAVSGEPNKKPALALRVLPNKATELTVSGFPQSSYRIDSSPDLSYWVTLSAVGSVSGISKLTNSPPERRQFFRAVLP